MEGLTLLAARPKIGKTWLALDIAIAVATGGYCLGDIKCEQGDVLFLALEDNKRRMQRRLTKLLGINKGMAAAFPSRTIGRVPTRAASIIFATGLPSADKPRACHRRCAGAVSQDGGTGKQSL